jgi:hypothetical protein
MARECSMSTPTSVQARVEQFLVERRQLGFSDDGYVRAMSMLPGIAAP